MAGPSHGGSELTGSSDGRLGSSSTMMLKEEVKLVVISTLGDVIMPFIDNSTRKVVKEELQIALQKLMTDKDRNNELAITSSSERRNLQLKFLDEISPPVLTGEELNGKGGTAIRLAVVDNTTGQFVDSGPEASATVEILLLQANKNDNYHNWSIEDFNKRIIRGSCQGKPHFTKDTYVKLKGDNKKKTNPSLSDKIWRLRNIGKGGKIDKRLQLENFFTVEDLLIGLLKDYNGLKNIVGLEGKKWEDMVHNARACPSGKMMYLYINSLQNTGVVFDVHGAILGLYSEKQYVSAQMLSERNKVIASELFSSAIDHWKKVISFDDEISLQRHLASLIMPVDQSDSLVPGYSVGPHNRVTSEMIGAHSDTSLWGIIPNMVSSQETDLECFEPSFSIDDVPIMFDWDLDSGQCSNLYPETLVSDMIFENFTNEMNVEAGTEGTDFMLIEREVAVPNSMAQKRWKRLLFVSRFVSVRKMVASYSGHAPKRQKVC